VKQKFHKSDIPDGAEVVRKRLFYYMEEISNAAPLPDFAKMYHDSIHEHFADADKDELIRKLIWLQLRGTIDAYQDSEDLNAGYENKERGSRGSRFSRIFINLGEKDGLTTQKLVQFIVESTDIDPNIVERVTVRDLSSFFNVPGEAAEQIIEQMSNKKFKGRKVRLEEAEQSKGSSSGGGGGEFRGKPRPQGGSGGGSRYGSGGGEGRGRSEGGSGYGGGGGYKGKKKY
jgi:ATP-dependent RNA helicase DeaD